MKEFPEELNSSIFIVPDREAMNGLLMIGAKMVMKSGRWIKLVKELIVNEEFEKILSGFK